MIAKNELEKAFSDPVSYRLSPWSDRYGQRQPNVAEIKSRLLQLIETPAPVKREVDQ